MTISETQRRSDPLVMVVTLVAMVVGSQLMRVLFTLAAFWLRAEVGTIGVVPYALGPFVGSVIIVAAARRNPAATLRGSLVVLAVARLAEQLSHDSNVDLWSSLIGVTTFLTLLALLASVATRGFGLGLLTGLAADTAIKGISRTLDLSWISGTGPIVAVLVLSGALLGAGWFLLRRRPVGEASGRVTAIGLVGIGPLLFLEWQVLMNPGWVSTGTGWPPELALLVVLVGQAAAVWVAGRPSGLPAVALGALVLAAVSVFAGWESPLFALLVLAGLVAAGRVVAAVTSEHNEGGGAALAVAFGNLLMAILVFIYYTALDLNLPLTQQQTLVVAGVFVALTATIAGRRGVTGWKPSPAVTIAVSALAVVPAMLLAGRPAAEEATGGPFTVMSYNVAQGISVGGQLDPEAIARVVEGSGADIVGLQEVSRSWLIASGTDLVWWLSDRLNRPFTYGQAGDGGNALLTSLPVLDAGVFPLPQMNTLIPRSVLETRLDLGGVELIVLNTHLTQTVTPGIPDEEKEDDYATVQVPQLQAVFEVWAGRPVTVLVGDFNMRPEWWQTGEIRAAGFRDAWEAGSGPGYTTEDKGLFTRIDYVFHTSDLDATDAFVIQSSASLDHLPVVATLMRR